MSSNLTFSHKYRIGEACRILGITPATLRHWEKVFPLLSPKKTRGGQREYSVSGAVLIHQFVRIGRLSLLRGGARTSRDVPPFCIIDGTHTVRTLNRIGLRRAGYTSGEIGALRANFRKIFLNRSLDRALLSRLLSEGDVLTREMAKFILESKRGVCQSRVSIDKNAGSEYD